MSEWPSGQIVDPHTMEHVGGFPYADYDFLGGFSNEHRQDQILMILLHSKIMITCSP